MPPTSGERIIPVDIEKEMKRSYLEYSLSVIISRAIPDARDGLKPVQRRILTAMNDLNLSPSRPYRKSAKITGDVTGNYHPHGTQAVYDTMVRLAQDFSLRYPLVDGQGNFGSIDGDGAAAERYTEARMTRLAEFLLRDLDKETVNFVPNYDDSRTMPSVLPAMAPNLLMNGTSGIAVGMATNIPPHNLTELVDGFLAFMDDPAISVPELMKHVQGPDFPTGSIIHGRDGIRQAYETGRGRIVVRGRAEIEDDPRKNRERIIITEIPYQVNKAGLIEKIADLVKGGRVKGISDIRDESDRDGLRVVVELRKDAASQVVLNQLFKLTPLQQAFNANMLALVHGQPKVCGLKDMMTAFLEHREEVVTRRTRYLLGKAEAREHIVRGLLIAVDNIDEVVKLIRASKDTETAQQELMTRFDLSELQAKAILDMRLARLTGLERSKLLAEHEELMREIEALRAILDSRDLLLNLIRDDFATLREAFPEERRTEIAMTIDDFDAEDLIEDEQVAITISHAGYVKRTLLDQYRRQKRGGRGVAGMASREEDVVEHVMVSSTLDTLLVFTNFGRAHQIKVWEIPAGGRTARGKAFVNLLGLKQGEKPRGFVRVSEFEAEDSWVLMATASGQVKRTALADFARRRRGGVVAQGLRKGDELVTALLASEKDEVLLAKSCGRSIRFPVGQIRAMGRTARGVRGTAFKDDEEHVVSMVLIRPEGELLTITEHGYGKRTALDSYPSKNRGGIGVIDIKTGDRNGRVVQALSILDDDEIILITARGVMIRQAVSGISSVGRNTMGVKVVQLDSEDSVASVARISAGADNGNIKQEEPGGSK